VGLHTPADVHYGHAADVQQRRHQTLAAARQQYPTRFTTAATPKILNLPEASWINQPAAQTPAA
jgi:putative transposase